ncbi:hypothetical protein VNO78_04135 [Psophocarpus tetragonolobus]|uniref:F-box domain-containing protein n=1 Tax=Psophocarpus tetragonolobus TaxID=3891 RepID=A0AAN9T2K8_PSOTE
MSSGGEGESESGEVKWSKRQRLTVSATQTCSEPWGSNPHLSLPFDLIEQILERLPVKFLLQFQCVCKSWKSLISDPQFAAKHLRRSPSPTCLILSFVNLTRHFVLRSYTLSHVFNAPAVTATHLCYPFNNRNRFDLIVGSCHGILCYAVDQRLTLLWNPSTRKFNHLPPLDNQRSTGSFTIYGFGYDHFAHCYKVVAVFCYQCNGRYATQVKVLSLGTDLSWRRIQDFPSALPFDESGKFVSGTINWSSSNDLGSSVIVSLDLQKESYEEVLQPDYGVAVVFWTLGVLRDCLCVLCHGDTFLDVWLMKDYGNKESWTKLFRVPYTGTSDSFPYTKAICISEDDQVLLEFQSELAVYNPRNGTFKIPEIQDMNKCMTPEIYVESLISPCF